MGTTTGETNFTASEYWQISKLRPWDKNPRSIKDERMEELKTRLTRQGQTKPVLVTKDGTVIGGNMRLRAMQELGWDTVWVSVTRAETDKDIFDLALTDNEEFGYYEKDQLRALALSVGMDPLELQNYQITLGSPVSLDAIADIADEDIEEDEVPELDTVNEPESIPGEVYQLGEHRLLCGSATEQADSADLLLTDPPYNVNYEGGTGLKIQNDNMGDDQFLHFLTDSFRLAEQHMRPGAGYYIFHADSEGYNFRAAAKLAGLTLRQCLIWVKNSLVLGRQDYQWIHEPILYGWKDGAAHTWQGFFNKTTVVDDSPDLKKLTKAELLELLQDVLTDTSIIRHDKPNRNGEHPTMKPVALLARLIQNSSKRGDLILDNFLGSGSTLMAAEQTDRVCYGLELDPRYCDVIRKRYAKHIGEEESWQEATPATNQLVPA